MGIVFADGMSRPFSTIVVARRRSAARVTNARIARSSSPSDIWPWTVTTRTSGTSAASFSRQKPSDSMRLWTTKTCPPRSTSARIASRMTASSTGTTCVAIARRSFGGVSMTERSRMPASDRWSERGIGVADIARTSTDARHALMRSFCATPKRCSSSTTRRPRSLNATSLLRSRWVPPPPPPLCALFLRHAEALLLVHDEEAEVLERDVLAEKPVGPHDDVERSFLKAPQQLLLVVLRAKTRQDVDRDGKRREPPLQRAEVLIREDRRGRKKRGLLAVEHALEDRPHRDLGLPVPHVAAQQPVHRLVGLHVPLHVAYRRGLVGRLRVLESLVELLLPG